MDGRFWSGAAIALTVVIAGANALPALLLRTPAEAPVVPVANVEAPQAALVQPPVPATPVTEAEPAPVAASSRPAPAVSSPVPAAVAATPSPPAATEPARAQRPVEARDRKRPVRPAIYPMREFLAWRR